MANTYYISNNNNAHRYPYTYYKIQPASKNKFYITPSRYTKTQQPLKYNNYIQTNKQTPRHYAVKSYSIQKPYYNNQIPYSKYIYTKNQPTQNYNYYPTVKPTTNYQNLGIARQYYYPQYNYATRQPTTQYQYNYPSSSSSPLSSLQYEFTTPHKGHGFYGNELAQFWIICHDCPHG
uniref:Adhesive plaque matrix protein-like n=1 Tax=Parastrongyloides trichosuri TaxID=131310 RepID=A0A0N4ZYU5_PARTI